MFILVISFYNIQTLIVKSKNNYKTREGDPTFTVFSSLSASFISLSLLVFE